ncbi:hypothetical protein BOA8489_03015 [Boseongicola aestuarii]|uniref:Uncharacterized protein n=1 Tax=Boseongicola aestuarii TaxID=1470561 RepID=A0A238J3G8_9RHOB|nr:hypothetical protein BOA8489_03015 [Boseongicola aestuarii]
MLSSLGGAIFYALKTWPLKVCPRGVLGGVLPREFGCKRTFAAQSTEVCFADEAAIGQRAFDDCRAGKGGRPPAEISKLTMESADQTQTELAWACIGCDGCPD